MKIGFTELIIVCIVALLVLGPEKLPVYAKKLGAMLRELRGVTGDLAKEINENVVDPLNEVAKPLKEAADEITQPLNDVKLSIDNIGKPKKEEKAAEKDSASAEAVPTETEECKEGETEGAAGKADEENCEPSEV